MHVAVPEPVASDDDDRVTDLAPRLLEGPDVVVDEIEEVHHLVALLADVETLGALAMGDGGERLGARPLGLIGLRQRLAIDNVEGRVEEQQVAGASGVDDPCIGEHGQQLGGPGEGGASRLAGRSDHFDQTGVAISR